MLFVLSGNKWYFPSICYDDYCQSITNTAALYVRKFCLFRFSMMCKIFQTKSTRWICTDCEVSSLCLERFCTLPKNSTVLCQCQSSSVAHWKALFEGVI